MKRLFLFLISLFFISADLGARTMSFINKTGKPVDILVQVPGVSHNSSIIGEQPYADNIRYNLNASEYKQTITIPEHSIKSVYRTGDYIQRNLQWPTSFFAEMETDKTQKVSNAVCPTSTISPLEKVGYVKCFDLVVKQHADSEKMAMPDQDGKIFVVSCDDRHNRLNVKPFSSKVNMAVQDVATMVENPINMA